MVNRRFMAFAGAFALAASLAASGASAATRTEGVHRASASTTLTLYSSGDVNVQNLWQNDLIPLYEKSHPNVRIKLVYSAHGTSDTPVMDKIVAAEKAGQNSGYDILDFGDVGQLAQANLLQKLTAKEVPNLVKIDARLLAQNHYEGMPYRASSVVLAYNANYVKTPPKTLAELFAWIKANPGRFTYNSPNTGGSGSAFVQLVVRSRIPAAHVQVFITGQNKKLETNWTPGLKTLAGLGTYMYRKGFYPNGNTAVLNLLGSSSVWMAPVWSDMALSALAGHQLPPSIRLMQLQPPFSGGPADLGIPANSPHKAAADQFLNWLLTPGPQAVIVKDMNGYPGVKWQYVPKSVQKKFASISASYATGFSSFYGADLNQAWQNQVAGAQG